MVLALGLLVIITTLLIINFALLDGSGTPVVPSQSRFAFPSRRATGRILPLRPDTTIEAGDHPILLTTHTALERLRPRLDIR